MSYENPYTAPTLTGFNSSPPSDDGARTAANAVRWSTHLSKIGTPLKNYSQAVNAAVLEAFNQLPERLHPRTQAESDASVTRTDYSFDARTRIPVDAYGAVGDGATDDTQAFIRARNVANVFGGIVEMGPKTYFISGQILFSIPNTGLVGQGWASELKVDASAARFIPVLAQHATYQELKGLVFADFAINGNGKGTLDSGLLQINNAVGFLVNHVHLYNGGTPAEASPSGVGGLVISIGSLGAAGQPLGTVMNCLFENNTKAGAQCSTETGHVAWLGNISRNNTGNGESPGFQNNGGYDVCFMNNEAYGNEGNGFYVATGEPTAGQYRHPRHCTIIGNHSHGNGTGSIAGAGFMFTNIAGQSNVYGRLIFAGNQSYGNGVGVSAPGVYFNIHDDIVADGNLLYSNSSMGMRLQNCRNVAVRGGVIRDNNTANGGNISGVYVVTSGGFLCDMISIHGVTFFNTSGQHQKYPVFFDSANPAGSVTNFSFLDNPSSGHESSDFPNTIIPKSCHVRHAWRVVTSDATPVNAGVFSLDDDSRYRVELKVIAVQDDGTDGADYWRLAQCYRDGAGAGVQGTVRDVLTAVETDVAWNATIAVPGGNVVTFPVTGAVGATIKWGLSVEIYGAG